LHRELQFEVGESTIANSCYKTGCTSCAVDGCADEGLESCILLAVPATEHRPLAALDRLAHKFALRDELDAARRPGHWSFGRTMEERDTRSRIRAAGRSSAASFIRSSWREKRHGGKLLEPFPEPLQLPPRMLRSLARRSLLSAKT